MITSVRSTRVLFVLAILAGSFLLFLVQPMVARMVLPRLGGAPAVWNSAMLVYQALLLAGYAYAHALARLRLRVQAGVHLAVLVVAALWLPIGIAAIRVPAGAEPVWWVPVLLTASIGPLFFAIAAQAPLLQRWYAAASDGGDPYPLYAASNLGSFAGLAAYPLAVEPLLTVHTQSLAWSVGYAIVALLILGTALKLPAAAQSEVAEEHAPPPRPVIVLRWVLLAAVPSGLMLATTTYITTDIVAMPLLWVIPLGLYLLSWSVAFAANREIADLLTRIAPITILLFGGIMIAGYQERPWLNALMALVVLFMAAVALHTELFRTRPPAARLTGFYLATAAGGALGGIFAGLLAPVLFDWTYEFPLLILAAGALVPMVYLTSGIRAIWTDPTQARVARITVAFAIALLFVLRSFGPEALFGEDHRGLPFVVLAVVGIVSVGARFPYMLLLAASLLLFGGLRSLSLSAEPGARTRSYFGVYTVHEFADRHQLDHGTTVHGIQLTGSLARERMPTTYYAPGSGVGEAMRMAPVLYGPGARIGVVGLGTGTLACYALPDQHWRFYEIDPVVVRIARDTGQFTYLRDCAPQATIRLGDARLSLEQEPTASLDLLALDAFSSDAIPVHLMTDEAFATYARVLAPRGLLLVHISNRFIDLEPVIAAAAKAARWHAMLRYYRPGFLDREQAAASASEWIALSRDPATLRRLTGEGGWRPLEARKGFGGWTDDYSSILPLLKPPQP